MKNHPGVSTACIFILFLDFMLGSSALAQDQRLTANADDSGYEFVLEEVFVTAMRREQHPSDISASLGVISGEEIQRLGMDTFEDYSRSQPGVNFFQPVKNRSVFTIRGINTDIGDTQLTQEPVAVYINDMPVTQAYAALVQLDLRLYDVDRIEILRGPQGTLFGSGTLGGLVRVLTREPVLNEFEGSVQVDWGDVDHAGFRQRYDAMVNIPLGETVALRAVGYFRDEPGWVKNPVLGTENSNNDWGGRMALLWEPNERFSGKIEFLHQNSDPEDGDAWNPDAGKFIRTAVITEERKAIFSQTNVTLKYDFPDFATLTSSTNFQKIDSNWKLQTGTIPGIGALLNLSSPYDTGFFAQELRLVSNTEGPLDWVAGLFYLDSETKDSPFALVVDGLKDFVDTVVGPGIIDSDLYYGGITTFKSQELAGYGDLTWHFIDQWSLAAGLRLFKYKSSYAASETYVFDFDTLSPIFLPPVTNEADDSNYTWRTVLSYRPNDQQLFYASVSTGYRVGQVNPNYGPSFIDPTDVFIDSSYDPDETLNYELGTKLLLMDDRVQLNAAVYYIDWTDVQMDAVRPSDRLNFIANAGDAVSKGLELEVVAIPMDNLDIRVALSFQDSEIDQIGTLASFLSGAQVGDTMPGTADTLASFNLQYLWELSGAWDLMGQLGAQYVGDSPNRFSNSTATGLPNPDFAINQSYTNVNADLSLLRDQWMVSLYVQNLTNNDNIILDTGAVALGSGENHFITLQPRTFGVRVNYAY